VHRCSNRWEIRPAALPEQSMKNERRATGLSPYRLNSATPGAVAAEPSKRNSNRDAAGNPRCDASPSNHGRLLLRTGHWSPHPLKTSTYGSVGERGPNWKLLATAWRKHRSELRALAQTALPGAHLRLSAWPPSTSARRAPATADALDELSRYLQATRGPTAAMERRPADHLAAGELQNPAGPLLRQPPARSPGPPPEETFRGFFRMRERFATGIRARRNLPAVT